MHADSLRDLLEQVKTGRMSIETAQQRLGTAVVADLGYANVDLHRRQRCGFPEVIFCEGKTNTWVEGVVRKLVEARQDCLATRVSAELAEHLRQAYPQAQQDRTARTFWLPVVDAPRARQGKVVIVTAGTSDLPVAREALVTAEAIGAAVELVADVGVAGVHPVAGHQKRRGGGGGDFV